MPLPDPAALEALRAASGLSIDLEGRFCHRGTPITHARTLEALWGSLHRRADGQYAVQVGREVGYVRVEDAPYSVRGVTFEEGWPHVHLGDGTAERLDPATLAVGPDGVLRCLVKDDHRARFASAAQVDLGLALEEDATAPGRFALRLGERVWPVSLAGEPDVAGREAG